MTPAINLLRKHGAEFEVHGYAHDPDCNEFGLEAARKLGLDPARVFKTLIVSVQGCRPEETVTMVPVDRMLDLKSVALARGGKRAAMTDPALAQRLTGYLVGGISPLGQKRRLPMLLDSRAENFDRIYVSGGRRGLDISLAPSVLREITGATSAPIAR